jgi:hypothetical protein
MPTNTQPSLTVASGFCRPRPAVAQLTQRPQSTVARRAPLYPIKKEINVEAGSSHKGGQGRRRLDVAMAMGGLGLRADC